MTHKPKPGAAHGPRVSARQRGRHELLEPFFEVAAQLIPVLLLAMMVDERLQPHSEETAGERVMRSWLRAMLVIGELVALSVVAGGLAPSKGAGSLVASSMLLAIFLLAVPVVSRELKDDRSLLERLGHASAGMLVLAAVLGTLIAIQLS
jgi:uncharacterized membrane protein YbjE (DUF340 family)